jgi:hypothetical protein
MTSKSVTRLVLRGATTLRLVALATTLVLLDVVILGNATIPLLLRCLVPVSPIWLPRLCRSDTRHCQRPRKKQAPVLSWY